LVAALGELIGSRPTSLVSGLLAATCPFLVVYGSLGLYESVATKQSALLAFALWPFSLVLVDWSRPGLAARLARLGALALLSAAIAYAPFSILLLSELFDDLGRARSELYPVRSLSDALATPGTWLEQNWPEYRGVLVDYVTPAVIVAAAIGVGLGLRRQPRLTTLFTAWTLALLFTTALLADAPYPGYIHMAVPPLLVLAGAGCV
jgi:hypothetical protein